MNNRRNRLILQTILFISLSFIGDLKAEPVSQQPLRDEPYLLTTGYSPWMTLGSLFPRPSTSTEAKQRLAQVAAAWLNQWGTADVVLQSGSTTKPLFSLESSLLLPLYQTPQQLFLIQPGVQHHQKQTTCNLGFGSRQWPADERYWWGTSLFYDYCPQGPYHRLGLTGEYHIDRYRFTANGYLPMGRWRQDSQEPWEKRAASGLDLRLQWQLWQQPCLHLDTLFERYFSQSLVSVDNSQPSPHSTASTFSIDYTPVPLCTASFGYRWASGGKFSPQLRLQLTYHLGIPLAQQIDPALAAIADTPPVNRLAVIQRRSQMVLEQRARAINTTVEPCIDNKPIVTGTSQDSETDTADPGIEDDTTANELIGQPLNNHQPTAPMIPQDSKPGTTIPRIDGDDTAVNKNTQPVPDKSTAALEHSNQSSRSVLPSNDNEKIEGTNNNMELLTTADSSNDSEKDAPTNRLKTIEFNQEAVIKGILMRKLMGIKGIGEFTANIIIQAVDGNKLNSDEDLKKLKLKPNVMEELNKYKLTYK